MAALSPASVSSCGDSMSPGSSSCSSESATALEGQNCLPDISACQEFYTQRVQSLERFKEKVAENFNGNHANCVDDSQQSFGQKFSELQENMVALMEKDVTLMRQLLALGDTIEQLKSWQLSPASSVSSLIDTDTESNFIPTTNPTSQFLVNDNLSSSPKLATKQYFSRQNSVLRIPIPPSHRPRMKTITSITSTEDGDDSSSGFSSVSRGSSNTNFSRPPSFVRTDGNGPTGRGSISEETSVNLPNFAGKVPRGVSEVERHESQASFDSGIHLGNSDIDREVFV